MLTQIIWWAGNGLEALLLLRAVQGGLFKSYPIFYSYLSYVLLQSLLRSYVYVFSPALYPKVYLYTQLVGVAVGYTVIWEIYSQALARYPGVKRLARNVLVVVFLAVATKAFVSAMSRPSPSPVETTAEFERNLRTVQGILLVAIVSLLVYYAIPSGRNLKGMILGYGFFISTSVINLSLRSHLGDRFQFWWRYLQPAAYLTALLIWCLALWSYQPNLQPHSQVEIERDYKFISARTARLLAHLRDHLLRVGRP